MNRQGKCKRWRPSRDRRTKHGPNKPPEDSSAEQMTIEEVEKTLEFVSCSNYHEYRRLLPTKAKYVRNDAETRVEINTSLLRPLLLQIKRQPSSSRRRIDYKVILRICQYRADRHVHPDRGPQKGFHLRINQGRTSFFSDVIRSPIDITELVIDATRGLQGTPKFLTVLIVPRSMLLTDDRHHDQHQYYFTLLLVNTVTKDTLMRKIQRNRLGQDQSLLMVRELLGRDQETGGSDDLQFICTTNYLSCPLWCPLTRQRLKIPVRGKHCRHYQCFDAEAFLDLCLNTGRWLCPICSEHISAEDLQHDCYFCKILIETKDQTTTRSVRVFLDGRFESEPEPKSCITNKPSAESKNQVDDPAITVITIDEDDDDDETGQVPVPPAPQQPPSPERSIGSPSDAISVSSSSSSSSSNQPRSTSPDTIDLTSSDPPSPESPAAQNDHNICMDNIRSEYLKLAKRLRDSSDDHVRSVRSRSEPAAIVEIDSSSKSSDDVIWINP